MDKFTRPKFQSLSNELQHKHCMIEAKRIYTKGMHTPLLKRDLQYYLELLSWMGETSPSVFNTKTLSDRFHYHQQKLDQGLRESQFLPKINQKDRSQPIAPPLSVSIVLDNLRSAHNVGSILRTVEALSLGTVYGLGTSPSIKNNQVKQTSMGSSDWISYQPIETLEHLPKPLIALETVENSQPLNSFQFPTSFTLIVGNEEYGCSDNTLSQCDKHLQIPLYGRKNSLNVANAFAIAAYEIRKQLTKKNNLYE